MDPPFFEFGTPWGKVLLHVPVTLPETNITPENGWLEYYFPIGKAYFQGRTVSFREGKLLGKLLNITTKTRG